MADGRIIVKSISYDARISGLSINGRLLWPYVFAHSETTGMIPRDARQLRLMCVPDWKDISDSDMESAVLEWLSTKPPMISETMHNGIPKLLLNDFEICNWNLEFLKKKRWRRKEADSPGQSGIVRDSPLRSEGKGSEVKNNNREYIASFEQFWKAYPRKEGRKPALEAWLKLRPDGEQLTRLLQALLKYKSSAAVRDGCILAPARWLTEERWTDEVEEEGGNDPIYA